MNEDRLADYEPGSPTRLALDVLGHKWTLLIVLALKSGPQRFSRLRSLAPELSSQVLTDSLRLLERDGIIVHRRLDEVSPHAAYSLTALGETLCEPARAIRGWAERNGPAILAARKRYDGTTGGHQP